MSESDSDGEVKKQYKSNKSAKGVKTNRLQILNKEF